MWDIKKTQPPMIYFASAQQTIGPESGYMKPMAY